MRRKRQESVHLRSVEITCYAPEAERVLVAGTFNGWAARGIPLKKVAEGMWRATIQLAPGSYEYKFLTDGNWVCKPGVD